MLALGWTPNGDQPKPVPVEIGSPPRSEAATPYVEGKSRRLLLDDVGVCGLVPAERRQVRTLLASPGGRCERMARSRDLAESQHQPHLVVVEIGGEPAHM